MLRTELELVVKLRSSSPCAHGLCVNDNLGQVEQGLSWLFREEWRAIPDHEGQYEVSNLGNVRTLRRHGVTGGPLSQHHSARGYLSSALYTRGKEKQTFHLVHRLVLRAFVGECPEGMETRHLNGDPLDNRLSNLAWGTKAENTADRTEHMRVRALKALAQ